ncbi:Pleckstrin y protein [Schistosoma japonicum]|uniref:Pleckstrin y protein n=1 Tax=Schistosoma japonicum TaxID=6182 RepID=A0A4Z2CVW0_SCHJA|nr:Pleckstrin y protein [Schistosoma japonicum]
MKLPKKTVTGCQTRRPNNSLSDPVWTLAGVLSHRYKANKWIQLNLCLLTNSSKLIAYKTGHSTTPSLALFLYGSTGIYSGRDSGMEHVIKIVHLSREIIVLAAPTEEQAWIWVKQINQYSQGSIPIEVCSFLPHFNVPSFTNGSKSTAVTTTTAITNKNSNSVNSHSSFTSPQSRGCNLSSSTDVTNMQVGGAFSPLTSTLSNEINVKSDQLITSPSTNHQENLSSEDHCVLLTSCEANSSRLSSVAKSELDKITVNNNPTVVNTDSFFSGMTDSIHTVLSRPLSMTASSIFDTNSINLKQNSRRSSLISSMRRKVESFSSKHRRTRKSLPQSLQPPNSSSVDSYSSYISQNEMFKGHRRMLSDGQWVNNISSSNFPSVQCLHQQQLLQPPPPAACVWDSCKNSGKGFGWSQLESAGTKFLNQHTATTLTAISTSNRPRSACYDSLRLLNGLPSQTNLCLTPKHGPLLDLNALRSQSTTSYATSNANQTVISGDAFISIPGRVSWTIKWCCLKLNCLEIYQSRKDHDDKMMNSHFNSEDTDENCYNWPLFSLPLEPGKVELGLAGDKRHSSAIRLAVPTECSTPLLFDAVDKLQMGSWIRGFIQALGLISGPIDAVQQKSCSLHRISSAGSRNTVLHPSVVITQEDNRQFAPLIENHTVPAINSSSSPWTNCIPDSIMETSHTSMHYSDIHDDDYEDNHDPFLVNINPESPVLSNVNSSNMVIYDEVCPPQPTFSTVTTSPTTTISPTITSSIDFTKVSGKPCIGLSRHRWSSPLLIVDSCTKLPGSVYYSSDESNEAGLLTNTSSVSLHWHRHIPPPSRRLLAQPLPPLPSVGPSTCESTAGTIASSCTSSNLTPDDLLSGCQEYLVGGSTAIHLETDNYPLYWSKKDRRISNRHSSLMNHRRYASMSSLEYSIPYNESTSTYGHNNNEKMNLKEEKKMKNMGILKQFLSHKQSDVAWNINSESDNFLYCYNNDIIVTTPGVLSSSICDHPVWSITSTTAGIGVDSVVEQMHSSSVCSTFTSLILESDNTTLHKTDSDSNTCLVTTASTCTTTTSTHTNFIGDEDNDVNLRNSGDEVSLWKLKTENFLCSRDPALVECMKSSKLISARRCVSCLSGNKPTILRTNFNPDGIPISSSTLPIRCGFEDTSMMYTEAITSDPALCRKSNKYWNRGSYSSNSSRTATSSGVALTAEFSSPGSGGTTRPPSLTMSNYLPVTPVEEEQTNIEVNGAVHKHNDQYNYSFKVDPSKNTRKSQSFDYGCQVEIPTSMPIPCYHQYTHNVNNIISNNNNEGDITKDSLPHSTSLILIASQLKEIKQETNSLRSRKRDLSFRLSNHLSRGYDDKYVRKLQNLQKLNDDIVISAVPNNEIHFDKENSLIDKNFCDANDNDFANQPGVVNNDDKHVSECNGKIDEINETTASLYARLTAIEMLLRNAESTEARLEKEFGHLLINYDNKMKSLSIVPQQQHVERRISNQKSFDIPSESRCSSCKIRYPKDNPRKKHGRITHRGYKSNSSSQQIIKSPSTTHLSSSCRGCSHRVSARRYHRHHHFIASNYHSKPSNCCNATNLDKKFQELKYTAMLLYNIGELYPLM